jgi:hypothetical protein
MKHPWKLTSLVLAAACSGSNSGSGPDVDAQQPDVVDTSPTSSFVYPRGCYGAAGTTPSIPAPLLANPGLTGVIVPVWWSDLEAGGDNQFAWNLLDGRIADAEAHGKVVIVGVMDSAAKAPAWLVATPGVQTMQIDDPNPNHSNNGQVTVVPFWDPTFRAQRLEMIRAVGARYANDPMIIGTTGAFINYYTDDWDLPPAMATGGYSYATMIDIGKEVLATTAEAWPGKAIKLPISRNDASTDPDKLPTQMADDIIAYAQASPFADRFFAQKNLINTRSPYASTLDGTPPGTTTYLLMRLRDLVPHSGLQMVAAASNGDTDGCRQNGGQMPCPPADVLAKSLDISLSYKPTFLEFWTADAANPDFYTQLTDATHAMNQP